MKGLLKGCGDSTDCKVVYIRSLADSVRSLFWVLNEHQRQKKKGEGPGETESNRSTRPAPKPMRIECFFFFFSFSMKGITKLDDGTNSAPTFLT
jgi:hypothetical protein